MWSSSSIPASLLPVLYFSWVIVSGSCYVGQSDLELMITLPLPLKCHFVGMCPNIPHHTRGGETTFPTMCSCAFVRNSTDCECVDLCLSFQPNIPGQCACFEDNASCFDSYHFLFWNQEVWRLHLCSFCLRWGLVTEGISRFPREFKGWISQFY